MLNCLKIVFLIIKFMVHFFLFMINSKGVLYDLQKKYYTSIPNDPSPLNAQWVTGFCDAEGCFSIIIQIISPLKIKVKASFEINLHIKDSRPLRGRSQTDVNILYQIKSFFGVGNIYLRPSYNKAVYRVNKISDLINVIIPHFNAYPLLT